MNCTKDVSILKELGDEHRVIIRPTEVKDFVRKGFNVFVENGAGMESGYNNNDYERSGASIVEKEQAWNSKFVLKFKAPKPEEYKYLYKGLHLGAFLHAEGNKNLTHTLCDKGVTSYAYEFFKTNDNIFPMSLADSEIAGKLAVINGAYYLQNHLGGSGTLLSNVPNVNAPNVLVIGYGVAGNAAIRLASNMGANVTVLGTNAEKLRRYLGSTPSNVQGFLNTTDILEDHLKKADLVLGCIQISTYDTPTMIDEHLIKKMKPGSVIIDVTSGYGPGYLGTFDHNTSLEHPIFKKFGVLHCKIDNLPAAVSNTTTNAVSPLVTPYLINLGKSIYNPEINDSISTSGKVTEDGMIAHSEVDCHMKMYTSMELDL